MEFMSDLTSKKVDVDAIVAAYRQIGDFLKTAAPEALTGGEIKTKARKPKVVPTPAEVTDAVAVVTEAAKSGDEQAEEGIRVALQKLGLEEKPPTMSRKVRGRIPARAFGGEGLVA